jgi:hypothetical protein
VAGVLAAGVWSLRGYYPHIAVSGIAAVPQARATSADTETPVIQRPVVESPLVQEPAEGHEAVEPIVAPQPPPKWNPPTDTRSVVKTVPQ